MFERVDKADKLRGETERFPHGAFSLYESLTVQFQVLEPHGFFTIDYTSEFFLSAVAAFSI